MPQTRRPEPLSGEDRAAIWRRIGVVAIVLLGVAFLFAALTATPLSGCPEPDTWVYVVLFSWLPASISVVVMDLVITDGTTWAVRRLGPLLVVAITVTFVAEYTIGTAFAAACNSSAAQWAVITMILPAVVGLATVVGAFVLRQAILGRRR